MKLRDLMYVATGSTLVHVVCRGTNEAFSFRVNQYNTENGATFDSKYGNYEVMAFNACNDGGICVAIQYAE